MSVLNSDVLDGVAHNNGELVMLISDHLDWSNEGEHLLALQDKINAYIAFWETMQYKKIYHGCSFASAKIELHEKYDPSPNFYKFLKTARNYMKKLNMKIEVLSNIEAKDVLDEYHKRNSKFFRKNV